MLFHLEEKCSIFFLRFMLPESQILFYFYFLLTHIFQEEKIQPRMRTPWRQGPCFIHHLSMLIPLENNDWKCLLSLYDWKGAESVLEWYSYKNTCLGNDQHFPWHIQYTFYSYCLNIKKKKPSLPYRIAFACFLIIIVIIIVLKPKVKYTSI